MLRLSASFYGAACTIRARAGVILYVVTFPVGRPHLGKRAARTRRAGGRGPPAPSNPGATACRQSLGERHASGAAVCMHIKHIYIYTEGERKRQLHVSLSLSISMNIYIYIHALLSIYIYIWYIQCKYIINCVNLCLQYLCKYHRCWSTAID